MEREAGPALAGRVAAELEYQRSAAVWSQAGDRGGDQAADQAADQAGDHAGGRAGERRG